MTPQTMPESSGYDVTLQQASPRGIARVRARIPGAQIGARFRTYLDQVYAAARGGALRLDGQNIFVYRDVDGAPGYVDVDFGVGVATPFTDQGNVTYGVTPSGAVATTTHRGDYGALADAHAAVVAWCRARGVRLAGPRWEVYGHWQEQEVPRTDVYHLIAADQQPA